MGRVTTSQKVLSSAVATAHSTNFDCKDFKDVIIVLAGSATPNWNVKIKGGQDGNTFTSAASETNPWSYIHSKNLNDDSAVTGSTGVTVNTTTPIRLRLNVDFIQKICLEATRTGGTLDAWIEGGTYY